MRVLRVIVCLTFVLSQILIAPASSTNELQLGGSMVNHPVITEFLVEGDEFVELYNPSDEPISLSDFSLIYRGGGASYSGLINFEDTVIQPKQFVTYYNSTVIDVAATGYFKSSSSSALNNTKGSLAIVSSKDANTVFDYTAWGSVTKPEGYYFDIASSKPTKGNSLQRCFNKEGILFNADPRDTSKEFLVYDTPTPFEGIECYEPEVVPDETQPVTECTGVIINEIGANLDEQFIELRNSTNETVKTAGCFLATNRNNKAYEITHPELKAGEFLTVKISDTNLTLTKTTKGTVYLLSSDNVEVDVQEYKDLKKDKSWSRFDDGWAETYAITIGAENIFQEYLPCDEGYFRNEGTGRCNKVVVKTLTPCKVGQYRSPETNRCRKVVGPILPKPCRADQYRNPETNRCRKLSTLTSSLKPCRPNQYRSLETNRCRKKEAGAIPDTAFKVEKVSDSPVAFAGWWAIGGAGALAGGYAGWEWRRELMNFVGKLRGLVGK